MVKVPEFDQASVIQHVSVVLKCGQLGQRQVCPTRSNPSVKHKQQRNRQQGVQITRCMFRFLVMAKPIYSVRKPIQKNTSLPLVEKPIISQVLHHLCF